jgi:hypothetical protein
MTEAEYIDQFYYSFNFETIIKLKFLLLNLIYDDDNDIYIFYINTKIYIKIKHIYSIIE